MPQRSASAGRSVPVASEPSTNRGIAATDNPVASSMAGDHARCATSSQSVPAASDISDT